MSWKYGTFSLLGGGERGCNQLVFPPFGLVFFFLSFFGRGVVEWWCSGVVEMDGNIKLHTPYDLGICLI